MGRAGLPGPHPRTECSLLRVLRERPGLAHQAQALSSLAGARGSPNCGLPACAEPDGDALQRLQACLRAFEGSHSFHNFTQRRR